MYYPSAWKHTTLSLKHLTGDRTTEWFRKFGESLCLDPTRCREFIRSLVLLLLRITTQTLSYKTVQIWSLEIRTCRATSAAALMMQGLNSEAARRKESTPVGLALVSQLGWDHYQIDRFHWSEYVSIVKGGSDATDYCAHEFLLSGRRWGRGQVRSACKKTRTKTDREVNLDEPW
jgi:hypothetical protein